MFQIKAKSLLLFIISEKYFKIQYLLLKFRDIHVGFVYERFNNIALLQNVNTYIVV